MTKSASHLDNPFLWGTATSAHQVEGNNQRNDWWSWEQAGRVREPSGLACDHYQRYAKDFDLLSSLGHTAHRFSVEWSRLEPEEGRWDDEVMAHYEKVLEELVRRNIEPIVTLHHFTNPLWFAAKGGWLCKEAALCFSRYTERVVRSLGQYVRYWITINEPVIYLYHGYFTGLWPPGEKSYHDCLAVLRNLLNAHVDAYRLIHAHYAEQLHMPVWVSISKHVTALTPERPLDMRDRWTVFLRDWFVNQACFKALVSGFLFFPGVFCEFLKGSQTLDFLGVNYYTRNFIRFGGLIRDKLIGDVCPKSEDPNHVAEYNDLKWEVYAQGLYEILMGLCRYRLPILVTENGICTRDDSQRERFIRDHLSALQRARAEGAPVFGYLYWSFLDNFEWADGFGPRFGVIEVDYKNQQRKIRSSAHVLTENCRKLIAGNRIA